jgi:ribonucleoside-triphosphate reductase
LCNAGHISYIEFDDYPKAEVIEKIIRHSYDTTNVSYLGFNFHIRYCLDCAERMGNQARNNFKKSVNCKC